MDESESQERGKEMVRFKKKMGNLLAAALLAAACMAVSAPTAYAAGGPSGPAMDTEIGPRPIGPGIKSQEAGAAEQGQTAPQGAGTPEQQGQAAQGSETPEQQSQTMPQEAGTPEQQSQTTPQEAESLEQLPTASQEAESSEQSQPQQDNTDDNTDGLVYSGGRYIDPSKPMIALTFDDGPYAPVGNQIMDCLEKYNGRSTFFVVGNRIPSYKTEIQRMHDDGHEIGNHTYEHKYLTKLSASEIRSQIDRCNQAIEAVTGEPPALVRLPGGSKNNTVMSNVSSPIIMWNIDTQDWKTRNTQKTINAVLGKVHDGDIVLMHELYKSTGDAVETIVPALVEQGYQLVTVSELASFRGGVQTGKIYNKFRP